MLVITPSAYAANGDTIYQCDFETGSTVVDALTACGTDDWASQTGVSLSSDAHGGSKAYSSPLPSVVYAPFDVSIPYNSVTAVYWEKYDTADPNPGSTVWNVKTTRFYISGAGYYPFMSRHNGDWFTSGWGDNNTTNVNVAATSAVTQIANSGYPISCDQYVGPATCTSTEGKYEWHWYPIDTRATSGWNDEGWHKVRIYAKVPTTSSATDGEVKVWIDDVLITTVTGIAHTPGQTWGTSFELLRFNPSSEFLSGSYSVNHLYDDMVVYEGYVPPGDETPTGSLRPGVSASGVTFR